MTGLLDTHSLIQVADALPIAEGAVPLATDPVFRQ